MDKELISIINAINAHPEWPKNAKIRYAYVELGRILRKNTRFFYTVGNKLLNDKEALKYSDEQILDLLSNDSNFDYEVICRNAANMLIYIFNNVGIESQLRRSYEPIVYDGDNGVINVHHYFLTVIGDDDKMYFLTINPDLANIQIGSRTSHFANKISYYTTQKWVDDNGVPHERQVQNYEGPELHCDFLTNDQIYELDKLIGFDFNYLYGDDTPYYTDYFFNLLEESFKFNRDYYEELAYETGFYSDVCRIINGITQDDLFRGVLKEHAIFMRTTPVIRSSLFNIPNETWDLVQRYVVVTLLKFLKEKYNLDFDLNLYFDMFKAGDYNKINDSFKRMFIEQYGVEKLGTPEFRVLEPLRKVSKLRSFLETIDLIKTEKDESKYKRIAEKFFEYLKQISLTFVEDSRLPLNPNALSSDYIAHKLYVSLSKILDVGHITDFNKLGLAEQITIMKQLFQIILSDVTANKDNVPLYRADKSNVENRVFATVILDKKDISHAYYFIMVKKLMGDNSKGNGWKCMLYDFKNNTIKPILPIEILGNYYIIRDNDLKLLIEEMVNPTIVTKKPE